MKSVHRRSFFLVCISLYLYNFHAVFQTCQLIFHQKCLHHYFMFSYLKNNVKFNVKLHWSKENIKWWKNILEQCMFPIEQQGGIFIKGFNPSLPESFTAKKKKFSIKAFFSKCDQIQIRSFLYWRNSKWKLSFFVQCFLWFLTKPFFFSWTKTPKLPKECDWL